MGGFGSGRHSGKNKVQQFRSLDVNKMKKAGALRPGISGQWGWQEDGVCVAKIGYKAAGGKITLNYRYRAIGGDWEGLEQLVQLLWTPCRYGGERAYFRCPGVVNGVHCMRTVVKL